MDVNGISLSLIWNPDNQYYLSGFRAISYSRPIVTSVGQEVTDLIIPVLEELHAAEKAKVDKIHVYHEQLAFKEKKFLILAT